MKRRRRNLFRKPAVPASIIVRRNPVRLLVVLLVIAGVGSAIVYDHSTHPPSKTDDLARYHDRRFMVARVIDGDTIDIAIPDGSKSTTRIRLWGVDCPEVAHGNRPAGYFSGEARTFAQQRLKGQKVHVLLAEHDTRGKYGRLLAYVSLTRDGETFNEQLLRTGHAYADFRFEHPWYERFKSAEKSAKKAGVGLWAEVTPDDMPAWRRRWERK